MIHSVKCILLGSTGVGKSSLLLKYVDNDFISDLQATLGVDYKTKTVFISETEYKLNLWDTAGQERFKSIVRSYYNYVNCVFFCFSLVDHKSFVELQNIIDDFDRTVAPIVKDNCSRILVGTFYDKSFDMHVGDAEINRFIKKNDIHSYHNVSSKTGINVNELFNTAIERTVYIYNKKGLQFKETPKLELDIEPSNNNTFNSDCCTII